ncbi:MAG: hypothetical protein H0W64_05370 [Gammaproteobacteria bacterium]|nr:hypothetical protein [Gammaproteobacteria bacterium]
MANNRTIDLPRKNQQEDAQDEIIVSVDNELFLAICYDKKAIHTYTVVGIRDKRTDQNHILSSTGKYLNRQVRKIPFSLLEAFFSVIPGRLKEDEGVYVAKDYAVTYKAFTITEQLYQNYLEQLFLTTRSSNLGAFHKDLDHNDPQTVRYVYSKLNQTHPQNENPLNQSASYLSVSNTCRNTAKVLLDVGIGGKSEGQGVSSCFLTQLPFKTKFNLGKMDNPLFIFPISPCKEKLSAKLFNILSVIYQQLESFSKIYESNPHALEEFEKLKGLYKQLEDKRNQTVYELFRTIDNWEFRNQQLVKSKHKFSFFSPSPLQTMLAEIKKIEFKL